MIKHKRLNYGFILQQSSSVETQDGYLLTQLKS